MSSEPVSSGHLVFQEETLHRHFGRIWPVHVEAFTELLIKLRRSFDGDIDRMIVLAVIGARTMPLSRARALDFEQFMGDGPRPEAPRPINVQSIADYSGVPRETVRRKVRALEAAGLVERHESGYLYASTQASEDLMTATRDTFKYLVAVGSACVEAVQADGTS